MSFPGSAPAASSRSVEERNALFNANLKLALYAMGRLTIPRCLTMDEAHQAALLGLLRAAELYDPSRGAAFSTFAYPCIRSHVFRAARRTKADRVSGRGHLDARACRRPGPEQRAMTQELVRDVRSAVQSLSPQRAEALAHRMEGLTHVQAGEALGVTRARVGQVVQRALRQIAEERPDLARHIT